MSNNLHDILHRLAAIEGGGVRRSRPVTETAALLRPRHVEEGLGDTIKNAFNKFKDEFTYDDKKGPQKSQSGDDSASSVVDPLTVDSMSTMSSIDTFEDEDKELSEARPNSNPIDSISDSDLESVIDGSTDLDLVRRIAKSCLDIDTVDEDDFAGDFAQAITQDGVNSKQFSVNLQWGEDIARGINRLLGVEYYEVEKPDSDSASSDDFMSLTKRLSQLKKEDKELIEAKLEEKASEDMLSKVKASFTDYLKGLEDEIKSDREILDKKKKDLDLTKRSLKDMELQAPEKVEEYQSVEEVDMPPPVKRFTLECGTACDIYGNDSDGYVIRRGSRELPSRFRSLDDADMALQIFNARRGANRVQDDGADYLEEK